MSMQKYPKAYEAYQQAVYRDGRNPTFWCSIGVLYYQINQYRDALDAYSRAIRLNPNISEVWYDLGTLVSRTTTQLSPWSTNTDKCNSTNRATTRPATLSMPTLVPLNSIRATRTSRPAWLCSRASLRMVCQHIAMRRRRRRRMCTLKPISLVLLVAVRLARNGVRTHKTRRLQVLPRLPSLPVVTTGMAVAWPNSRTPRSHLSNNRVRGTGSVLDNRSSSRRLVRRVLLAKSHKGHMTSVDLLRRTAVFRRLPKVITLSRHTGTCRRMPKANTRRSTTKVTTSLNKSLPDKAMARRHPMPRRVLMALNRVRSRHCRRMAVHRRAHLRFDRSTTQPLLRAVNMVVLRTSTTRTRRPRAS